MSDSQDPGQRTVSTRAMDLVVALALMAVAGIVIWDSRRLGAAWGIDGPEAGYFPFYVGLILFLAAATTFATSLLSRAGSPNFVGRAELTSVMQVLIPTIIFVALIGFLGIYVAGALFVFLFMIWLGRYPVWKAAPIAVGVPIVLFVMFEIWFLVPLPKGPLEAALGY